MLKKLGQLVLWFFLPAVPLAFLPSIVLAFVALFGWLADDDLIRTEWYPYPMFAALWCGNALAIQVLWGAL